MNRAARRLPKAYAACLADREGRLRMMQQGSRRYRAMYGERQAGWNRRATEEGVIFERRDLRVRATLGEADEFGWGDLTVSVCGFNRLPTSAEVDEVRETFIGPEVQVYQRPGQFIDRMVLLTTLIRVAPILSMPSAIGSA